MWRLRLRSLIHCALAAALWARDADDDPGCDRDLLVSMHRQMEPTVRDISEIHYNYTSSRHYEVVEIISVFHLDQLARSALRYVESLRLTFCVLICPNNFALYSGSAAEAADTPSLLASLSLVAHLNTFFADVRHLASHATGMQYADTASMWEIAESELIDVSQRLETFVQVAHSRGGHRLLRETFESFEPLVGRILHMVTDFVLSMGLDTSALFSPPNYVAQEMTPLSPGFPQKLGSTVDIFMDADGGSAFKPDFMQLLSDEPTVVLTQPSFASKFSECDDVPTLSAVRGVLPHEFLDHPFPWSHRDVSGVQARRGATSPLQLLQAMARHVRLSNLFISVQVSPYILTPAPFCGSSRVLFDPTLCLVERQWGGYFFQLNPLPPFNLSVVYTGKPLGPGAIMPVTDVHSIHVPSMDTQWSSLVSTFKSMNHHSPDVLFIHPFAGNCQIVDRLLGTGSVRPKIVYLPVNPLRPPPEEVTPDFFDWWSDHGEVLLAQLMLGVSAASKGPAGMPVSTSVWLSQCSLVAGVRRLRKHGYVLLHLEHTFAVFVWRSLFIQLFGEAAIHDAGSGLESSEPLYDTWLRGWQCSPMARFLFDLEVLVGPAPERPAAGNAGPPAEAQQGPLTREALRDLAAGIVHEVPTMKYFLERGGASGRAHGRCSEGLCECLPPFRGDLCQHEDPPRVPQDIRAVIHYTTAETERDLADLSRSLSTLWARFNWNHDYPVVIFHEGLSLAARRRVVFASENRVWLALLPRFKEVPLEWAAGAKEMGQDFSVGYRAMTRWRSGPLFLEPALQGFDYAMTLDTDSYFPANVTADPFRLLHQEGWVAAFPHLGRESASVVVNFMHHFLLYCRLKGMDPRRTAMLSSLIEKNYKWYQQCLMLDIEVLRLDFFRGQAYQDFFRYMDSTGGFWLHRWGNNPVRTFAVGLLLEDHDVRTFILPYAHQDYCSCGPGMAPCRWDKELAMHFCNEVAASPSAPGIGVEDLAEGLLDLQPWRGTERQKQKFSVTDIHDFVAEQTSGL